jgi:hypothetical protein
MKAFTVLMAVLLVVCPAFREMAFADQISRRVVSTEELQRHVVERTAEPIAGPLPDQPDCPSQETEKSAKVKRMIQDLGVGAELGVTLVNGTKHRGLIEEIEEDFFRLQKKHSNQPVGYGEVSYIRLANPKYKAKGQIDPARVRQIVVFLGPGKKVKMKLGSDHKLDGTIQSVNDDSFAILNSKSNQATSISFGDVTEIEEKKLPGWAVGAIVAGTIFGLLVIIGAGLLSDRIG